MEEKLVDFVSACSDVALTADIWTDRRAHAFLGVTVHAFRCDEPVSRLQLAGIPGFPWFTHRPENCRGHGSCHSRLHEKVRLVVTDNASNMVKSMSVLLMLAMPPACIQMLTHHYVGGHGY